MIDDAITPRDANTLIRLLAALGASGIFYVGLCLFTYYAWVRISLLMLRDMRPAMFAHMQTLPIGFFTRATAKSDLSGSTSPPMPGGSGRECYSAYRWGCSASWKW